MPAIALRCDNPTSIPFGGAAGLPLVFCMPNTNFIASYIEVIAVVRLQSVRQALVCGGRRLGWETIAETLIGDIAIAATIFDTIDDVVTRLGRRGPADILKELGQVRGVQCAGIVKEVAEGRAVDRIYFDGMSCGTDREEGKRGKGEKGESTHVGKEYGSERVLVDLSGCNLQNAILFMLRGAKYGPVAVPMNDSGRAYKETY